MNFEIKGTSQRFDSRNDFVIAWIKGRTNTIFSTAGFPLPTKKEVLKVLKSDSDLAQSLVKKNIKLDSCHDVVILEQVKNGYEVYDVDRGKKVDAKQYSALNDALEDYVGSWGLK
jgi:hypothetical protein